MLIDRRGSTGKFNSKSWMREPDDLRITLATIMMDVINEEEISGRWDFTSPGKCRSSSANIELSCPEVTMGNVMSREMIMKEYIDAIRCRYDYIPDRLYAKPWYDDNQCTGLFRFCVDTLYQSRISAGEMDFSS